MKNEEIKEILTKIATDSSEQIFYDLEIDKDDIAEIYHSYAQAWYINNLAAIPKEIKRELVKKEFNDIKKACQSIVKLVDSTLKSDKFNSK